MDSKTKTCLIVIIFQVINAITAQEMQKRAPQGFFGMRGKKEYDDVVASQEYLPWLSTDRLSDMLYPKRAPMGFMGMRGKKSEETMEYVPENLPEFLYPKRSPMGFMGMRGKKSEESEEGTPKRASIIGQIEYGDEAVVSPGEFPLLEDIWSSYLNNNKGSLTDYRSNEISKRAPQLSGFYGVRGKKSNKDVSFRGKFIGVRGKKDLRNSGLKDTSFLLQRDEPWTKRKGQMGFFGMRGKKWDNDTENTAKNVIEN